LSKLSLPMTLNYRPTSDCRADLTIWLFGFNTLPE
jgi:hypothetical protein